MLQQRRLHADGLAQQKACEDGHRLGNAQQRDGFCHRGCRAGAGVDGTVRHLDERSRHGHIPGCDLGYRGRLGVLAVDFDPQIRK